MIVFRVQSGLRLGQWPTRRRATMLHWSCHPYLDLQPLDGEQIGQSRLAERRLDIWMGDIY
jgi:hypothetical protein